MTSYVNASICKSGYKPVNLPILLEVDTQKENSKTNHDREIKNLKIEK